jgi:hypothetical protein
MSDDQPADTPDTPDTTASAASEAPTSLIDGPPGETPFDGGRSVCQAGMITAALGLAHAILVLISSLLMSTVPDLREAPTIEAFYSDVDRRRIVLVGLYLLPFAVITFIWFEVALRMWISGTHRRANVLLSNVQLVSGIVFVTLFAAANATTGVTAAAAEYARAPLDPQVAALLPTYGDTLLFVFAIRMAAMFMFTTTSIARSADVLPRWFVVLGYVLGLLLLLSATFSTWLALVFPVWLMVLSALLVRRARAIPAHLKLPPSMPMLPGAYPPPGR